MSLPLQATRRAVEHRKRLAELFPWTTSPLLIGAPMRVFSGPAMAVAVSRAGGLGFIGPGTTPEASSTDLAEATKLLKETPLKAAAATTPTPSLLPIGVGFQVWNGDLDSATAAVRTHRPCAVWLFAPRDGQAQLDTWTAALRAASPGTQVWVQVGTLQEAVAAAHPSGADALVLQGAEAGGHGRASDGIGLVSLLPEVADALHDNTNNTNSTNSTPLPLVGAGGIADGRGAVAALGLGAAAVAMGTRFLAASEARVDPAYQAEVLRATDGAAHTGRTQLYNHLRGTFGWPAEFSPRGLLNQSWADHEAGVPFDELQARHDAAVQAGGAAAWGPEGRTATYVSASVGLVRSVDDAGAIVEQTRNEIKEILSLMG
ncbi:nitronate monooxygenase [Sporothrix schenckii 1099-18]|uniref:Nitronate monooxygenase n=1 Tax=Sporothrix schenckii 1099-18 TaxID=1397361 RepID=A0A0F2MA88_SPOSC|nr:nitronate monooxygenase [Sporothrix schenckii 1099-18]KJR85076.1 nitronate monooxygenase [Sporothrix schenckii 1099-18]